MVPELMQSVHVLALLHYLREEEQIDWFGPVKRRLQRTLKNLKPSLRITWTTRQRYRRT